MSADTEKRDHFDFDDFSDEWVEKRPDCEGLSQNSSCSASENAIRSLEEEQEMLTTSLMSLTTHFAQVQLRLRQIMEAPAEERDELLGGLVDFAFSGIPELPDSGSRECREDECRENDKNRELINALKSQLEELEKYAYESGDGALPQSILVEKQKVIIDELKSKINLHLDETDLPQLSPDDLKKQVDSALGEFVSPLKMKEQLVTQLKTQITDLERFIKFLQLDAGAKKRKSSTLKCECKHAHAQEPSSSVDATAGTSSAATFNGKALGLMDKVSTMLQFFAASQFGCGSQSFQMNTLKRTYKGNHWGDMRAALEVDVQEVLMQVREINKLTEEEDMEQSVAIATNKQRTSSTSSFDSKSGKVQSPELAGLCAELTATVRKRLAISIEKLMEHGLRGQNETTSIVPFIGCFSHQSASDYDEGKYREMYAWELILEFYHIKNGEQYNETPSRMLSQSYNLDIVAASVQSNKQSLLGTIGSIIALHSPYKRSHNAHFKAFISAGLK